MALPSVISIEVICSTSFIFSLIANIAIIFFESSAKSSSCFNFPKLLSFFFSLGFVSQSLKICYDVRKLITGIK